MMLNTKLQKNTTSYKYNQPKVQSIFEVPIMAMTLIRGPQTEAYRLSRTEQTTSPPKQNKGSFEIPIEANAIQTGARNVIAQRATHSSEPLFFLCFRLSSYANHCWCRVAPPKSQSHLS